MKRIFIVLFCSLLSNFAFATSKTWVGSVDSVWTTANNWSPAIVPGTNDTVIFNPVTVGNYKLRLDTNRTVHSLTLNVGAVINLASFELTVSNRGIFYGGTVNGGKLKVRGSVVDLRVATFNTKMDVIAGQVKLDGGTYMDSCYFEQNGTVSANGTGGNKFYGNVIIKNSGTYWITMANAAQDTFFSNVQVFNSAAYGVAFGNYYGTVFKGQVQLNCTAGKIAFGRPASPNNTVFVSGSSLSVGSSGFSGGFLAMTEVDVEPNVSVNVVQSSSGGVDITASNFNSKIIFNAPTLLIAGSVFNKPFEATKTSTSTTVWDGGNIFYDTLKLTSNTLGFIRMAGVTGDSYYGPVYCNTTGSGGIQLAYKDTSRFESSIFINTNAVFNASTGVPMFTGNKQQTLSAPSALTFKKFVLNKSDSSLVLSVAILVDSIFQTRSGRVLTTATNLITLKATVQPQSSGFTGYVNGPLKKFGNTAYLYPVGKNSLYRPLGLSAPVNASDAYTIEVFTDSLAVNNNSDTIIKFIDHRYYWDVVKNAGTSTVSFTAYWDGNETYKIKDYSSLRLAIHDGTMWKDYGASGLSGSTTSGQISSVAGINVSRKISFVYNKCFATSSIYQKLNGNLAVNLASTYPAYTYLWSNAATSAEIANDTIVSRFFCTITDSKGCKTESYYTNPKHYVNNRFLDKPENFDNYQTYKSLGANFILNAKDDNFNSTTCTFTQAYEELYEIKNIISLDYHPRSGYRCSTAFTYNVPIQIEYNGLDCITRYLNKTLTISYDPSTTTKDGYRSVFEFDGGLDVSVKVLPPLYTVNCIDTISETFTLGNQILVARQLSAVCSPITVSHTENTLRGEIEFTWPNIPAAYEYDFEWTFYDSGTSQYVSTSAPASVFENNASRVTLDKDHTNFVLDKIYPAGKIFYRVRPVTYDVNGTRLTGDWSSVGNLSFSTGHISNLNWNYQLSLYENGGKSPMVSYYDGTYRERQVQTKSYKFDDVIVGQSIYDYTGRPAVKVLPVPSNQPKLGFIGKFNRDMSGEQYSSNDFDEGDCSAGTAVMDSSSGSSRYYSSSNPDLTGLQKYLPLAKGYPFTVTEFTSDKTGRIRRQSGVGPDLKLGSAHDTRYYYSRPATEELDRLFGNDAGEAKSYLKEMVLDANNQVSVTYKNAAGKVVATALAGEVPAVYSALPNTGTATNINVVFNDNQITDISTITSTYTYCISSPGTYAITYTLSPKDFSLVNCKNLTYCYDCYYDVRIKISDNCGNAFNGGTAKIVNGNNHPFTYLDTICATKLNSYTPSPALSVNLPVGEYTFEKIVTVNQSFLDKYKDFYVRTSTCSTFATFLNQEIGNIDLSGCNINCEQCREELPDHNNFISEYVQKMRRSDPPDPAEDAELTTEAENAYKELAKVCDQLCGDGNESECQQYYDQMLLDVKPGGQYNDYTIDDVTGEYIIDATSVLYRDYHANMAGCNDQVIVNGMMVYARDLSMAQLIDNWRDEWANYLVSLHPEYCYYDFCDKTKDSQASKRKMLEVDSYLEAINKELFCVDPGNITVPGSCTGLFSDNIFSNSEMQVNHPSAGMTWIAYIQNKLNNYIPAGTPTGNCSNSISAWEFALAAASNWPGCPNDDPNFASHTFCTAELNKAWIIFRNIYLGLRDEWYTYSQNDYAARNNCCNTCIGDDLASNQTITTQMQRVGCSNYSANAVDCALYGTKTPVFPLFNFKPVVIDQTTLTSMGSNVMIEACSTTCHDYREVWKASIINCINPSDTAQVLNYFEAICRSGCSSNNPYGTTSIDPLNPPDPVIPYTTFEEVLAHYNATACTIDFPEPYNATTDVNQSSSVLYIDIPECICHKITASYAILYDEGKSEEQILAGINEEYNMHFTAGDLQYIMAKCNNINPLPCSSLDKPLEVSPELACRTCLDCEDLNAYAAAVTTLYGIQTYDEDFITKFTDYVNEVAHMNQTSYEYVKVLKNCGILPPVTCKSLDQFVTEFKNIKDPVSFPLWLSQQTNHLLTINEINQMLLDCHMVMPGYQTSELDVINGLKFLLAHLPDNQLNATYIGNFIAANYTSNTYPEAAYLDELCNALVLARNSFPMGNPNYYTLADLAVFAKNWTNTLLNSLSEPAIIGLFKYCQLSTTPEYKKSCEMLASMYSQYNLVSYIIDSSFTQYCNVRLNKNYSEELYDYWLRDCNINTGIICSVPEIIPAAAGNPCMDQLMNLAYGTAWSKYEEYVNEMLNNFTSTYLQNCTNITETFKMTVPLKEYQYTLYYYDYAGNLVKTVPPSGVNPLNASQLITVAGHRSNSGNAALYPTHTLASKYYYNSLNKITKQSTPDGGQTIFFYDKLGRVIASQNDEQYAHGAYSYSVYDMQGRVIESGRAESSTALTDVIAGNTFSTWLGAATRKEVVNTWYDTPYSGFTLAGFVQQNVRNRVASITYTDAIVSGGTYSSASHYTYDILGNVQTVIQEYKALAGIGASKKRIDYSYDLVSGKVNQVWYQRDETDQYVQRYFYDQDNRLASVETSEDGYIWYEDARYAYYKHGPLGRTELGEYNVQGVDYAYTLSGWLKLLNSVELNNQADMGEDGSNLSTTRDAFAYSLGYFNTDYISAVRNVSKAGNTDFVATNSSLYNGNIKYTTAAIKGVDNGSMRGNRYGYDQLNRLIAVETFNGMVYNSTLARNEAGPTDNKYREDITYDPNGNILTFDRNGDNASSLAMDDLGYNYYANTNRLNHVTDGVSAATYVDDIDNQPSSNYIYDATGNLIKDFSEKQLYSWYNNGKLRSVIEFEATYQGDPAWMLEFFYDPMGNRIEKRHTNFTTGSPSTVKSTYYVRDAQGNVLSTYTRENNDIYKQDEISMYGSSRLGVVNADKLIYSQATGTIAPPSNPVNHYLGLKQFELTNHLGNVMATISDQPIGVDINSNFVNDYYEPVIMSGQDYYAFGSLKPSRTLNSGDYKYGFNGKENDNEVKGNGNSVDFGARVYDARIGKWLSLDPLQQKYPQLSPFNFVSNNPVYNIEVDGRYFTGNTESVKNVYSIICKLASEGNKRAIEFKATLEKMDASDVEINVQNSLKPHWFADAGQGGSTTFDVKENRIVLDIFTYTKNAQHPVSEEGRTGHEIEHGAQFIEGELSFIGSRPDPLFYDQTDEEKAYQIQNLITNTQLQPGERPKTDQDAKEAANYPKDNPNESTISKDQAVQITNSTQTTRKTIYNYKPTEKQKSEKQLILTGNGGK